MGHLSNDEIQKVEEMLKICYQKSPQFCGPTEKWQHGVMREIRKIHSHSKPSAYSVFQLFKDLVAPVSMVACSVVLLVGVYITLGNSLSVFDMALLYSDTFNDTDYHSIYTY